jgi:hypothetical protein
MGECLWEAGASRKAAIASDSIAALQTLAHVLALQEWMSRLGSGQLSQFELNQKGGRPRSWPRVEHFTDTVVLRRGERAEDRPRGPGLEVTQGRPCGR